jgi:ABC-2 type transport system permease protein
VNKIFAIGRAEYLQAVRSKAFLIGLFLMPVLMGGSIVFQVMLDDQVDLRERTCAVVDSTGELYPVLESALAERNESIWETDEETGERTQTRPAFALEVCVPDGDERVDVALSARVESGDLHGFLLIGEYVLSSGDMGERPLAYHTREPTFTELPDWLESTLNEEVRRRRFDAAGVDRELVAKLDRRVRLSTWGLAAERSDGTVEEAEEENELRTFGIPAAAMFLLFMLVMTSAPQLMNQVLEEKMQRIAEVLVSAVTPFELMLGKLLGSAGVSMTLALCYLGGVAWATNHWGVAHFVPLIVYVWFIVMMLFALLMYGSLFSALGSACSELRDAQSMMMPAMIILMVPLFAWTAVLESPNGTVAQVLTYFPTATPMVFLIRLLAPPGPPVWEIFAALGMCIVTMLVLVWASGKIFRIGVLSQGQTPTFGKLISWVLSK